MGINGTLERYERRHGATRREEECRLPQRCRAVRCSRSGNDTLTSGETGEGEEQHKAGGRARISGKLTNCSELWCSEKTGPRGRAEKTRWVVFDGAGRGWVGGGGGGSNGERG
jgi:hypothetical protein